MSRIVTRDENGRIARRPLEERFWEKVDRQDDADCWPWIASIKPTGYGYIWADGRDQPAHRVAYELLIGPISEGLQIDHLCRVRHCVNPAHMELVTSGENTLRGESGAAKNARKTHCIHGHEFTPENTYLRPEGRTCRACDLAKTRRKEARRKARSALSEEARDDG